jgi:hypothetical protein
MRTWFVNMRDLYWPQARQGSGTATVEMKKPNPEHVRDWVYVNIGISLVSQTRQFRYLLDAGKLFLQ